MKNIFLVEKKVSRTNILLIILLLDICCSFESDFT